MKNLKQLFILTSSILFLSSCQNKNSTIGASASPSKIINSTSEVENSDTEKEESTTEKEDSTTEKEDTESNSKFEALSMNLESGQKFNYYLYTPKNVKENSSMILYLHGGSGKPTTSDGDLNLLTNEDGLPKFVKDGLIEPDSYIVFPQLPYKKTGWSDVKDDLLSFLDILSTNLKCNKSKLSITGHSMGGKGTWDIALAYPSSFYKVAPLSGNVTLNPTNLNKLKNKPVWAIVGDQDTIVDPSTSINFINELSKINDEAKITVIEGYGHFDVPQAYLSTEYNLLSWLID